MTGVINSLESMAKSVERAAAGAVDQLEMDLGVKPRPKKETAPATTQPPPSVATQEPAPQGITQLSIAGAGTDKIELHVGDSKNLQVFPLTYPVTAAELSAILGKLA